MLFFKSRLSQEDKELVRNEKELNEYNRKQEKYNNILKDEIQKQKFKNNINKVRINTFTKRLVTVIIGVCIIDLQFTYLLAFLGKTSIVEQLSTELCNTILGVAFVYIIRAYLDTRIEHKELDQKIKNEITSDITDKINDVLKSTGLDIEIEKDDDSILHGGLHINKTNNNNNNNS